MLSECNTSVMNVKSTVQRCNTVQSAWLSISLALLIVGIIKKQMVINTALNSAKYLGFTCGLCHLRINVNESKDSMPIIKKKDGHMCLKKTLACLVSIN